MSTSFPYAGWQQRAYYNTEATFGTFDATATRYCLPWNSIDPGFDPGLVKVRSVGSAFYNSLPKGMKKGNLKLGWYLPSFCRALVEGSFNLTPRSVEVLYHLGEWASPSSIISLLFKGCRTNKFTIEAQASEKADESILAKATAELICQNLATASAKQGDADKYDDSYVTAAKGFYDTYITKGGVEITDLVGWKLNFDLHLKPVPVIRSTSGDLMKYLNSQNKEVSLEMDLEFESKERFDDIIADTARTWIVYLSAGTYFTLTDSKTELVNNPARVEDLIFSKVRVIPKTVSLTVG